MLLCTEASVISGYEKTQESDRQLPQPGEEKQVSLLFFCFYHLLPLTTPQTPPSFSQPGRSAFAASIWVHLSQPRQAGGPLCPLWLQGLSVALVWVLVVVEERGAQAGPLAHLDHLKAPIQPYSTPSSTQPGPAAHPRCP